jgi:hypothetical protein
MIELRWVGKHGSIKLQYRYRRPNLADRLNAYPPQDWGWSEWIDVTYVDPHLPAE